MAFDDRRTRRFEKACKKRPFGGLEDRYPTQVGNSYECEVMVFENEKVLHADLHFTLFDHFLDLGERTHSEFLFP
jgi:hypothetical protein